MSSDGGSKSSAALTALERVYRTPLDLELTRCLRDSPVERALDLFRSAVAGVPAYPRFLAQRLRPKPRGYGLGYRGVELR